MFKLNKRSIRTVAVFVLLICLDIFLRNIQSFISTTENINFFASALRGLIYISLFSVWSISLRYRIIQTQAMHYLTAISALMVFWIGVRTTKFLFFADTSIDRYLWYLYYLPLLFIPLLALLIALSHSKSEEFRLPNWTSVAFGVSALLLILVMTNDYHQLVFGFPNGLLHFENGEYIHRFGYYIIIGWVSLCTLAAFVFIAVKCRVPYSKRFVYFPFIPLSVLIIYVILYLTVPDFISRIAGDMTVVSCVLTALTFETGIQFGLIRSNTHYNELFECADIHVQISDSDYNVVLSSADTEPLSKDLMRQTEIAPVMLDNGFRLCGAPIKMGHVLWLEDVSEMTEVISELADNSEYLTSRRTVLHKEVETRKKEQRLTEQNRLYNRLMNDNHEELVLFSDLLGQIEATNDVGLEKKLIAKLAVVCTHIKRRGNLIFLSENGERIKASEVRFALEEWLSNLRLCSVKCNLYFNIKATLTCDETVALYNTFQQVIFYTLDSLNCLLVSADEKDGMPFLLLNLSCDCDLTKFSCKNVCISDEDDGEWVITISVPKGGTEV